MAGPRYGMEHPQMARRVAPRSPFKPLLAVFYLALLARTSYGRGNRVLLQDTGFSTETSRAVEDLFPDIPDLWVKEYYDVKSDTDLRRAICNANGLVLNMTDPILQCMPPPPPPPTAAPTPAPTFFWESLDDGITPAPTIPQTPAPTEDFQLINAVYVELSWDIRLNGIPLPPVSGMLMIEGICHKAQYRGDRPCKIHAVDERCSNCLSPRTGSDESCNDLCDKGSGHNSRILTVLYGGKMWLDHVDLTAGKSDGDGGNLLLQPGDTDAWGTDYSKFTTFVQATDVRFTKGHAAGAGGAVKVEGGAIARLIRPIFKENHADNSTRSHDVQVMNGGAVVIAEPLPWELFVSAETGADSTEAHGNGQVFMWAAPPPGVFLPPPYPPPRPPAPVVDRYRPPAPQSILMQPPPPGEDVSENKSILAGSTGVAIVAGGTVGVIAIIAGCIALSCWRYSKAQKRLSFYSNQGDKEKEAEKAKEKEKEDSGLAAVKDRLTSDAPDAEPSPEETRDEKYLRAAISIKRERSIKNLDVKDHLEANREESPKSPLINAWATEPPIYDTALPIEALEDLPLPDVKSGFTLFTHKSFNKKTKKAAGSESEKPKKNEEENNDVPGSPDGAGHKVTSVVSQ